MAEYSVYCFKGRGDLEQTAAAKAGKAEHTAANAGPADQAAYTVREIPFTTAVYPMRNYV